MIYISLQLQVLKLFKEIKNLSGIAVGYNSNDRAIRAYLDPTEPRDSFIHYITVNGSKDKTAFVIWLPTPSSPLLLLND